MATLTFVLEDGQEIVVPLAERVTLGRAEDNDVVVDDDRISKRHAELVRNADGSVQVFDSDSTAGTFVNGERVRSRTIQHGDRLSFGPLSATLDLEDTSTASNGTVAPANGKPTKAGRIGPRKKDRGTKKDSSADKKTSLPPEELLARLNAAHQEEAARLEAEKSRLQTEVDAVELELRDWQQRSEKERGMHNARVESLRAEEQRLAPLEAAVKDAEAAHAEWIRSIQELSGRHEEKAAALQRLTAQHDQKAADLQHLRDDESSARRELETLAAHRDQTLAHLQQIRAECAHDETVLDGLRRQLAETESHSQERKELAEAREDQVKVAEKKLEQLSQRRAQIEAHIKELTGTEEKLAQALVRCREAEAGHAALTTTIAGLFQEQQQAEALAKELESRIAASKEAQAQAAAEKLRVEESLRRVQNDLASCEKTFVTRSTELVSETQRLEEARTQRAEIEKQCQELAGTGQKLSEVRQQLAGAEKQLAEARAAIADGETRATSLQTSIKALEGEEGAAQGRLEVLHAREKDLRAELATLAASERAERGRFEEIRQIAAEAEKGHAAQKQQIDANLENTRQELDDLVSRLTPLRDWKEAMDQLYSRLATLPQDSPEARDLWHEIEKEKAGLHDLITTARTQAGSEKSQAPRTAAPVTHARPGRATGSVLLPGSAQETTLRARLSHLRENVQREEARIEQLRLERIRHENPGRPSPAADAMLREQTRHLETKMRQEEERYHALQRTIEISQAEAEKRRERLGDMERKLAELRADIVEAERQRSTLRQQADLAQTELKNYEAALERVTKKQTE